MKIPRLSIRRKSSLPVQSIHRRVASMLTGMYVLGWAVFGVGLYKGISDGSIQSNFISSTEKVIFAFAAWVEEELKVEPSTSRVHIQTPSKVTVTTNSVINITTNGKTVTKTNTSTYIAPTPKPTFDQDAWFREAQAENARKQAESEAQMQAFKAQSEASMKAFEANAQQGLQDFQAQGEADRKAFLESHGITP